MSYAHSQPDQSHGDSILGVAYGTLAPALVVVLARIYARIAGRVFGVDDGLIAVSALLSIFGSVCNVLEVKHGFGRHIEYLNEDDIAGIRRWSLAAEMQAAIGLALTKISICWFVLRFLKQTNKWKRIVIWTNMACIFIITVVYTFFQGFSCIPLEKYWNPALDGRCISLATIGKVALAADIIDVITDFLCAAFPLAVIKGLKMERSTKLVLGMLVGLGFLTAATSIGKAITVEAHTTDPSWGLVTPTYWVIIEQNASLLVASLPGLRQFLLQIRSRWQSHREERQQQRNPEQVRPMSISMEARPERASSSRRSLMDSKASSEWTQRVESLEPGFEQYGKAIP